MVATISLEQLTLRSDSTPCVSIIPSSSLKLERMNAQNLIKQRRCTFLRHHLHPDLKSEYMTERDPLVLWQFLKHHFSQQWSIVLPRVQQDWITLCFLDFKSVAAYNSALHRIVTKMRLCGQKITDADMIGETLSTFHPGKIVLQQ